MNKWKRGAGPAAGGGNEPGPFQRLRPERGGAFPQRLRRRPAGGAGPHLRRQHVGPDDPGPPVRGTDAPERERIRRGQRDQRRGPERSARRRTPTAPSPAPSSSGGEWSDGRDLQAEDFVYAWQRLADPANDAPEAALLSVVAGYDDVRQTGDVTALQVTAEDAHTLTVVLNGTYSWFFVRGLHRAGHRSPAAGPDARRGGGGGRIRRRSETDAEEDRQEEPWWSDVTALVTNGPYQVSAYTAGEVP